MKKTVYEWLMAVGHRAGCHQRADRRFSGIWYRLYGDYAAVVRKKINTKELVKDVLSQMWYRD